MSSTILEKGIHCGGIGQQNREIERTACCNTKEKEEGLIPFFILLCVCVVLSL